MRRFKMNLFPILLIFFLYQVNSDTTPAPFIDRRVEIEDCVGAISETKKEVSSELQCVTSNEKLKLGAQDGVRIQSVRYAQLTDKGKDTVCKKISSDSNYEIEIKDKDKVKSIVYQVGEEGKALLFGSNANECYKNVDVTAQEVKSGYLHVTSIKCFPKEQVAEYHKLKSSATTKEFREANEKVCFLAPMLKKDINLKVTINSKIHPLTISATPKQECPKCPAAETNSTKSTNTTSDSSTHAASTSTTIIVVVVVVIFIVLLGGVGFFMMKK